jgi:hypothetical protein
MIPNGEKDREHKKVWLGQIAPAYYKKVAVSKTGAIPEECRSRKSTALSHINYNNRPRP